MLAGFAGVAFLSLGSVGGGPAGSRVGITVVVLGSLSWSIGSFGSQRITMPANPFVADMAEMAAGGVALLVLGTAMGERPRLAEVTWQSWAALAYLVLAGSPIGFTAYIRLLGNAPISVASTYAYLNPVVAVILGWFILSEPVTATMLVAGALIVAGVALVVSTERRRPTPLPKRVPAPQPFAEA